ncbi:MAG TPA: pseudouridine synthase [Candidatus Cybelea sp.]
MRQAIRLNRFLAQAGVASRRHADELIAAGRVNIDGRTVREFGTQVEPGSEVRVDGTPVALPAEPTYLLLNKPLGVVTTMHDPQGRRTVAELVAGRPRVFPVGRLDYATAGALLMTDDGELAHQLLHPRFGVDKTYRAEIAGRLSPDQVRSLMEGISLEDGRAAGAKLRVLAVRREHSVVDVTIHEGRNRQVRRMFEAIGHPILALTRTRFGPLRLGSLPPGHVRGLTEKELEALKRHRRPPAQSPRTNRLR